jgi:hypothetical protein
MSQLDDTIARAETEWQRSLLQEWGRRNPKPNRIKAGYLGFIDIVPTLCQCSACGTPSVIMPAHEIAPSRGFVLCPQCSAAKGVALAS